MRSETGTIRTDAHRFDTLQRPEARARIVNVLSEAELLWANRPPARCLQSRNSFATVAPAPWAHFQRLFAVFERQFGMYKVTLIPGDGVGPGNRRSHPQMRRRHRRQNRLGRPGVRHRSHPGGGQGPRARAQVDQGQQGGPQGADHDADRQGVPQRQRLSAAGAEPFCLCAAVQSCTRASARYSADRTSIWSSSARTPKTCTPVSSSRRASRRRRSSSATSTASHGQEKSATGARRRASASSRSPTKGRGKITDYAFDYALKHGRKSVTSVCKANIMKFTDGLWYDETRAVALAYGAKFEWPELATASNPIRSSRGR